MTWEIADREHPDRAGSRFPADQLGRACKEADRARPEGRFYVRWIGPVAQMPQEEVPSD